MPAALAVAGMLACAQALAQVMKLGVGTSEVPVGGYGGGMVAIHGPSYSGNDGPNMQFTTDASDRPVLAINVMDHDNATIRFDAYYDHNEQYGYREKFSSGYMPTMIQKYADYLKVLRHSGGSPTPGGIITWAEALALNLNNGTLKVPAVYSSIVTTRQVYVSSNGTLGTLSSSIRYKKNVRDVADSDTEWLHALRPRLFDYKEETLGTNEFGLIAEEVEKVCPHLVSYAPAPTSPSSGLAATTENDTPVAAEVPDAVRYDQLIVPLLAEVQQLRKTVESLKSQVTELQAGK